jgi:hypothetical protein
MHQPARGRDIQARAQACILRQLRRHDDRRDVLDLELSAWHGDAKTLEHVRQRLGREDRLLLVTGLVQTDDETVADERDRVGTLKRLDVRDPRAAGRAVRGGLPCAPGRAREEDEPRQDRWRGTHFKDLC